MKKTFKLLAICAVLFFIGFLHTQRVQAVTCSVSQGCTGWGNPGGIQTGAIPYGNGLSPLSTTTQGTGGFVLSWLNGIPKWIGTTTAGTGLTFNNGSPGSFSVNTTQNISTLSNLTSNGLIKTSSSNGTLSIATLGSDYVNGSGTSGNCVQWGASNALGDAGAPCGSGGGSGTVTSGLIGQNTYYAANGTTVAGTSTIFTDTNSNVGIGTSSPYAKLSVFASSTDTINTTLFAIGSSTGTFATSTLFNVLSSGFVGIATSSPWGLFSINGSGTSGAPIFTIATSTSGLATSFEVDSAGNVGIGTSTPTTFSRILIVDANISSLFQRNAGASNNVANGAAIFSGRTTASTLANNFGTAITFTVATSAGVLNNMAQIVVTRQGADTNAREAFNINQGGVLTNYFFIDGNTKSIGLGTTSGTGFTNIQNLGNETDVLDLFNNAGSTNALLTVTNTGNVGVGSTTPFGQLSVNGNAIGTEPQFVIGSSTKTNFLVSNTGFTGVGSTSPWGLFSVNGNTIGTAPQFVIGSSTATNFLVSNIGFTGVGSSSPWGLLSVNGNAIGTSPQFVVGSSTATNFIVTNAGNVGVGTSTPTSLLTVAGAFAINTWTNITNALTIKNAAGTAVFNVDTTPTTPQFAIGTSSGAIAEFQVIGLFGTPPLNNDFFRIASSTASATSTLFDVNNVGDISFTGDSSMKPTVNSCGSSAGISATSTDLRGTVKTGTGGPTSCTLTFAHVKADTPTCMVSDGSTAVTIDVGAASTSGVSFSMSAGLTSTNIYYWCPL